MKNTNTNTIARLTSLLLLTAIMVGGTALPARAYSERPAKRAGKLSADLKERTHKAGATQETVSVILQLSGTESNRLKGTPRLGGRRTGFVRRSRIRLLRQRGGGIRPRHDDDRR
jgi:hypothetical protein